MAISINDLIAKKEAIEATKKVQYDIETSAGVMTFKLPPRNIVFEALPMDDSDSYIVINSVVEPDLKDGKLMKAFGCLEPMDVPAKIFLPGEVGSISGKLMELAGYRKNIKAEIHETVKNS